MVLRIPCIASSVMAGFESLLDLPVNERFDERYEPRELLGIGGSGEVRVFYDRWMGREVALKALSQGATDGFTAPVAGRFFREARLQGQLEHPAVVPVHECGCRPDGHAYFTMKRVRGDTLADILERQRSEPSSGRGGGAHGRRRQLEAFLRICLAVDFAHSHGILHRDLKPSNVMLGDFGEVYLLDWGVAKVVDEQGPGPISARLGELPPVDATEQGSWMGTPGYMAPEQIDGVPVDERADVYSLGAILFEILTLEPLHPRGRAEAVSSTRAGVEARPSERCPDLVVEPELDAILQRATARNRLDRYPSARELANDVERLLDGERDLTLRQQLAEQHLQHARLAMERMAAEGTDEVALQRDALRNVGHALALHSDNREAIDLLGRLMVREPREDPPEVQRTIASAAAARRQGAARILLRRSIIWMLCVPMTFWLGFTRPDLAITVITILAVTTGLLAYTSRRPVISNRAGLALLVWTSLLFACFGLMFSPFVLVAGVVATNTIFFTLYCEPHHRKYILIAGMATLVGPYLAELAGWLPRSTDFVDGRIIILPRAMAYPPVKSQIVLITMHALLGVAPAFVAFSVRDQLIRAERRLSLAAWRMSQMVTDLWEGRPRGM